MLRRVLTKQQIRSIHTSKRDALVDIRDATFYHRYPSPTDGVAKTNPPLFSRLNFSLGKGDGDIDTQSWSIVSSSSLARTTFLQLLAGKHICIPPTARSYPRLSRVAVSPEHAIKYVGFDAERGSGLGGTGVRGAYLSARYESRREETDYSVLDYLTGHTELNAVERMQTDAERRILDEVVLQLNLGNLLFMPVAHLSNGQTRRARIAKALMAQPALLLLDGPFMGLDPNTLANMSSVLGSLAQKQQPSLVMSLRPEDQVPEWVSHLVVVDDRFRVITQGPTETLLSMEQPRHDVTKRSLPVAGIGDEPAANLRLSRDGLPRYTARLPVGEALVEMQGVKVTYGQNTVLGDWKTRVVGDDREGLWWSLHRGQRCGIFGSNGSGKTTMLSLITSDHPQAYSLPIKIFGRSRLPGPGETGISLFDLQQRIGHSSPEVHAYFPKHLSVRRTLESAWADAPMAKPSLDEVAKRRVGACLRWFARDLGPETQQPSTLETIERAADVGEGDMSRVRKRYDELAKDDNDIAWAADLQFRELGFSNQRLLLFLRALVAQPDLVILDEALSGMDGFTRDRALLFLSHGEKLISVWDSQPRESILHRLGKATMAGLTDCQALLVISHAREDVPGCVREWLCLPEPGQGRVPRTGVLQGPLELNPMGWRDIWGHLGRYEDSNGALDANIMCGEKDV